MGVHIYSGSLIRFYTNDWENEIQRTARENGYSYNTVWPDGRGPCWPSPDIAAQRLAVLHASLIEELNLPPESVLLYLAGEDRASDLAEMLKPSGILVREVVVYRVLLDLDTAATAAELGMAPGTVTTHLRRALARLRSVLASDQEQPRQEQTRKEALHAFRHF